MAHDDARPAARRERSARYPGVPLAEAIDFCRRIDAKGLDGLTAGEIAPALGFTNVRTNALSSRLSAARQFGLLELRSDRYGLTELARSLLHPADPSELPRLHRRALREPPLYARLAARLEGKRVPEAATLANILYHDEDITASAKLPAAEAFLASARSAGALGDDQVFRGEPPGPAPPAAAPDSPRAAPAAPRQSSSVRIDLRLWGPDAGQVVRVRAPEAMTPASFDRLLAALRLHIRIADPPAGGGEEPEGRG